MRFDESSAKYALFGDFYFGYILPPDELLGRSGCESFDWSNGWRGTSEGRLSMPTATKQDELVLEREAGPGRGFAQGGPDRPDDESQWGEGTMVIPAPREVDAIMKRFPRGS